MWNLAKRRDQPTHKWATIHGADLLLPSDHPLDVYVRGEPLYDTALSEFAAFLHAREKRMLSIVDVGANIGDTPAIIAARIGKAAARFTCIEADETYLSYFEANTVGLDIRLIKAFAAERSGESALSIERSNGTGNVVSGSRARELIALDDALGEPPDIIKSDTDGFELQVLRGAKRCLLETDPHIFVEFCPFLLREYGKSDPMDLLKLLEKSGYFSALFYDNTGHVMGLFDLRQKEVPMLAKYIASKPTFYADILLSRDAALMEEFYQSEVRRMPVRTSYD